MPLPPGAEPPLPPASLSTSLQYSASDPTTLLDRMAIRELMEGFPAHRDACEWRKMRALFADEDACELSFRWQNRFFSCFRPVD